MTSSEQYFINEPLTWQKDLSKNSQGRGGTHRYHNYNLQGRSGSAMKAYKTICKCCKRTMILKRMIFLMTLQKEVIKFV